MEISTRHSDNVAILDIRGEVIRPFPPYKENSRVALNKAIQEQIDSDISGLIINLDEVPMMDSVGLGMLVAAWTSLAKKEKKVVLLNIGRSVRYLLAVTKLDQIFEKFDDEDAAIESCKKK